MPEQVSDKPWSNFKASDYTDEQWLRACLIDRGASFGSAKMRGSLPVREPDGTLNRNACSAAAAVLSSAGGTGSARGNKLLGVKPAQVQAAKSKLVDLYKKVLQKDPPPGLVGIVKHSERLIAAALKHADATAQTDNSSDTTVAVVALPSALDPIRLVGDVDKHATLLFFGEMSALPSDAKATLLNTLAQVADLFDIFSEPIDGIQRLGSDNPPALVAMLDGQRLSKVREAVLINQKIQGYQSNTQQHPNFTPHVTFGYPDYQGETPIREAAASLYRVKFDRVALWWGNEHFEFDLSRSDNYAPEIGSNEDSVGMSGQLGEFLIHHGVKGMHWGVRRSSNHSGEQPQKSSRSDKKLNKLDKKWQKSVYTVNGAIAVHNAMAEHFNSRIGAINDRHPNADLLNRPDTPESKAYLKEVTALEKKSYESAVVSVHGKSPSGKMEAVFVPPDENSPGRIEIKQVSIQHAEDDEPPLTIIVRINDKGKIVENNKAELKAVTHSEDALVGNFLSHHGIKGMKWGVRRSPAQISKSHGGTKIPGNASEDAKKFVATSKKSPHELDDRQLREFLNRANMTKQYNQIQREMTPSKVHQARNFIATAAAGYLAYKKVDKASGGALSSALGKALKLPATSAYSGKHRG